MIPSTLILFDWLKLEPKSIAAQKSLLLKGWPKRGLLPSNFESKPGNKESGEQTSKDPVVQNERSGEIS